jgi:hypothetical protein
MHTIVGAPILLAAGCWVLGGLAWQLINAYRSRGWTGRTTGVVVRRGHEDLRFPGRRHQRQSFRMSVIEYEYVVDGQAYRSGKIAFTPHRIGPGSRRSRLIAELEPGREVEVCYNENRPKEAVLYPGFEKLELGGVFVGLAVAGLFIGVAVAMLLGVSG